MNLRLTLIISAIFASAAAAQTATPEVESRRINDVAMVFFDPASPTGAVILYNPDICARAGEACAFFRLHEHGHVALGHLVYRGRRAGPFDIERDADRYAAQHAPAEAVMAAWRLIRSGESSRRWQAYGTPEERARRICLFAQEADNWSGPAEC